MKKKNSQKNRNTPALWRLVREAGLIKLLALITMLNIGVGVTEIIVSNSMGDIVDSIVVGSWDSIFWAILILGGVKLIAALLQWLANNRSVIVAVRGKKQLILRSVDSYINADYNWINKQKTGDILSRLENDIGAICDSCLGYNLPNAIRNIAISAVIIIFMFVQNWTLAILFIVPIILYFLVVMWGNISFQRKMAEAMQAVGDEIAQAQDIVNNRTTVKTYRLEEYSKRLIDSKIQKAVKLLAKGMLRLCATFNIPDLLFFISLILVGGFGISFVINESMTSGALISFLLLSKIAMSELLLSGNFMLNYPSYAENARRIVAIWDAPRQKEGSEWEIDENIDSVLEFNNVIYSYPSEEEGRIVKALDGFSLKIKSGERVALVGPSGCGKSTALKLIMGICEPDSGEALLYGKQPSIWRRDVFNNLVTQMSQDTVLFPGTVRENILLGLNDVDDNSFNAAVDASNLGWAIKEDMFENGLDTEVGEMGKKLSGGQRQMVAIARVLMANPRVLLLDEATSALDAKSENIVNEALSKALQRRTVLMVTHRLNAAMNADQIVVMNKGRVVEAGKHKELLSKGGLYSKMWENEQKPEVALT